jgi:hypothetical protein
MQKEVSDRLRRRLGNSLPVFALLIESKRASEVSASTLSPRGCPADPTPARPFMVTWSSLMPQQRGWRRCNKCQGLFARGQDHLGTCPAGGAHDGLGSEDYSLVYNDRSAQGQSKWQRCCKCQGLAYAGSSSPGRCPAGGRHDHAGSFDYVIDNTTDNRSGPGQGNWRWCTKCQGMAFAGNRSVGSCPGGGVHDHTGSWNYVLLVDQRDLIRRSPRPRISRIVSGSRVRGLETLMRLMSFR